MNIDIRLLVSQINKCTFWAHIEFTGHDIVFAFVNSTTVSPYISFEYRCFSIKMQAKNP